MHSAPSTANPRTAHPAHDLFPVITDREWAASLKRARAERNELRERIRLSARKLKTARKDGL